MRGFVSFICWSGINLFYFQLLLFSQLKNATVRYDPLMVDGFSYDPCKYFLNNLSQGKYIVMVAYPDGTNKVVNDFQIESGINHELDFSY